MTLGLIGRTTQVDALKAGLDAGANRVRAIAGRIAQGNSTQTFSIAGNGDANAAASVTDQADPADMERDMASLADEQLRFEATARLLEKAYASLRASIHEK